MIFIGEAIDGVVKFDEREMIHMFICGESGSGKSQLGKLILYQLIKKNCGVFILDGKGGLDFQGTWKTSTTVVTKTSEMIDLLDFILLEMGERQDFLIKHNSKNINDYNARHPQEQLQRLIIFVDEIIDILDRTGRSKQEKDCIDKMIGKLSEISRLGRAFGITLILSTQKPSAKILPTQITNNLNIVICGRVMNKQVSYQVLGSCLASEIDNTVGRFVVKIGVDVKMFQSYYFDDSKYKINGCGIHTLATRRSNLQLVNY